MTVIAVIAADNARHVRSEDAEPYHARAKEALNRFPYIIGYWTGADASVPEAAVKLLRPNALISRRYINQSNWAYLLISQCKDSRDMTGHYPPSCYPNNGEPLLSQRPFHLKAGSVWIDGIEYQFKKRPDYEQDCERKSVYNFFVIPGRGIAPDISYVRSAAGDYQRRFFGAAQFQVVTNADQPTEVRDEVFSTLIGADTEIIRILDTAQ